jgi:branched-chain amino acid transport system permease protein
MLIGFVGFVSVIAVAMIYSLASFGLIITWRVAGVFNLAFGFLAALGAFLYWQLNVGWGLPAVLAAVLVVGIAAPLAGIAIQQILFRNPRDLLTALIITIGLGLFVNGILQTVWKTSEVRSVGSIFGDGSISVFGSVVQANDVGIIVIVAVIGTSLWLFLQRSNSGLHMMASVDNPELAGASGISQTRVNGLAWVLGTAMAFLAGILFAPMLSLDVGLISALVIQAFPVALFARLKSMPLAVVGALLLSYAQGIADYNPSWFEFLGTNARDVMPFFMLAVVLLVYPTNKDKIRVVGGGLEKVARERSVVSVVPALVLTGVLAYLAMYLGSFWTFVAITGATASIVMLSITLLTGASAQVSLGQMSLMGVGAVVTGISQQHGLSFVVAALIGTAAACLVGVVMSLATLRLRGLHLALMTMAFAYGADRVFFGNSAVIGPAGVSSSRPVIGPLNFESDRAYLLLVVGVLAVMLVGVSVILRGPWGRALGALTAGDAVATASGLSVRMWKVRVFALSSIAAGLAGALFAGAQQNVSATSFVAGASLQVMVLAVVGGVSSPIGAIFAGFLFAGGTPLLERIHEGSGQFSLILFGVMAMQMAVQFPRGYGGMLEPALKRVRLRRAPRETPPLVPDPILSESRA